MAICLESSCEDATAISPCILGSAGRLSPQWPQRGAECVGLAGQSRGEVARSGVVDDRWLGGLECLGECLPSVAVRGCEQGELQLLADHVVEETLVSSCSLGVQSALAELAVVERLVDAAVTTVLDGTKLGRCQDYFQAGLHSVSVARMRRLLEEDLGPIPTAAFFFHPAIAGVAAFIVAARSRSTPATGEANLPYNQIQIQVAAELAAAGEASGSHADALSCARLLLRFGGRDRAVQAERVCQAGVARWRGTKGAVAPGADVVACWRGSKCGVAPVAELVAARQLLLLAGDLCARRTEGNAQDVDQENVAELFGEALALSSSEEADRGSGCVAAEAAAVLAVWARTRLRQGSVWCAEGLRARVLAMCRHAVEGQCTGWGRDAGALRLVDTSSGWPRPAPSCPLATWVHASALLELHLEELGLEALPAEVGACLVHLRLLDVSHNRLVRVPALGGLLALKSLCLASNHLTYLPADVVDLPLLRELNIAGNRFRNPLMDVSDCRHLVTYDGSAQIAADSCLSAEARQRSRKEHSHVPRSTTLESMDVSFAGLVEGPQVGLGCGGSLKYYICAGNALERVPELRRCTSLTSLALGQNAIRVVPGKVLQGLPELRWLSLEANRLAKLPDAIGDLKFLRHLHLQGNRLEELPATLGRCSQLRTLELQNNVLRSLPDSLTGCRTLQFLYAHGNELSDAGAVLATLRGLRSLKIVGLGGNRLRLGGLGPADQLLPGARLGIAWNDGDNGSSPPSLPQCGPPLTELLSCSDVYFDAAHDDGSLGRVLLVCFCSQGAPTMQWNGQVQACRASLLDVDALYVCDPANAWYLQDPSREWRGVEYFGELLRQRTLAYNGRVLMLGGSMGATACILFAELAGLALAFSPQVELRRGQGRCLPDEVLGRFEARVAASLASCRGRVVVHVARRHHFDSQAARGLLARAPRCVRIAYHETDLHNTTKYLHERRGQLTGIVKAAAAQLLMVA